MDTLIVHDSVTDFAAWVSSISQRLRGGLVTFGGRQGRIGTVYKIRFELADGREMLTAEGTVVALTEDDSPVTLIGLRNLGGPGAVVITQMLGESTRTRISVPPEPRVWEDPTDVDERK